jgi:glucose/arabinose dehydrogenase
MRALADAVTLSLASASWAAELTDPLLAATPWLTRPDIIDPMGIRFTGPEQGFLIERAGAVKRFDGGRLSTALTVTPAAGAERGLLGIATHRDFSANPFVYLYYTAGDATGAWIDNRLTRYTWNGSALVNPLPLGTFGSAMDGQGVGAANHNGGPLVFGNDGKLYGVTGDRLRSGIEQNASTTSSAFTGGVFRLNPDGTIPGDNPFASHSLPSVQRLYSYGLRNSFGLAFDPVTARLWNTENGPDTYDEINLVTSGMNSGWRPIMGPDSRDPENAPADLVMLPGATYQDPKFSFLSPLGVTSIQFLAGSALGAAYDDAVLVGDYNSQQILLLRLNATRDGFVLPGGLADGVLDDGDTLPPFGTDFNVVTDIQVGPDGAVYVTTLGDTIYRIAPVPEPHTWMLSLVGLALVGWAARRRRGAA